MCQAIDGAKALAANLAAEQQKTADAMEREPNVTVDDYVRLAHVLADPDMAPELCVIAHGLGRPGGKKEPGAH